MLALLHHLLLQPICACVQEYTANVFSYFFFFVWCRACATLIKAKTKKNCMLKKEQS